MENYEQFKHDFNKCFEDLKDLIDKSFLLMEKHPDKKEEIINSWKTEIMQFINYTFKSSEKHNNKDVFKAITKALIFRK